MTRHTYKQFLAWAKARDVCEDERYPESRLLIFIPPSDHDRYWLAPPRPEQRPQFIATILELAGPWQSCYAWRERGSWPSEPDPSCPDERVEFEILKGLGLPLGTADAVEFDRAETDKLITLIFLTTIFAWSVAEDLTVVPGDAQHILRVSHHDVIEVSFRTLADTQAFVQAMKEEDYPLPDNVPDATFKRLDWMPPK